MDAATNFLYVEYLNTKSSGEVRAAFDRFLRRYKRELDACRAAGFDVTWRTDNGGEFTSSDLDEFCEEFAVKRSFSVPYAPPQNAHAERMWGILLRTMRITIAESKISERFWTYAMQNAVRLHNSLPSTKLDNNMSPYQAFTGKLPNLGRFRAMMLAQIDEKIRTQGTILATIIARIRTVRYPAAMAGYTRMSGWAHDSREGRDVNGDLRNRAHTSGILCGYSWRTRVATGLPLLLVSTWTLSLFLIHLRRQ